MKSKFSVDDDEPKMAFSLIRSCISETYVQCFQFKISNDVLFTNSRLVKIGLTQSELCSFCNTCPETIDHLFFYCVYSRAFWEEFGSYWIAIAKEVVQQMVSCISGNGSYVVSQDIYWFETIYDKCLHKRTNQRSNHYLRRGGVTSNTTYLGWKW